MPTVRGAQTDEQWVRRALALLERSAGALTLAPAPTRGALRAFAALSRGLGERCPAWLRPWPRLTVETRPGPGEITAALSLERVGGHLVAREDAPASDRYATVVLLEYYLHLVHDHVRACRLATRRPGRVTALLPGEEADLARAFEEAEQAFSGSTGVDRLDVLWEALAAPA
jgi:hypothetical protein